MSKRIGIVEHSGVSMLALIQALTAGAGFGPSPMLPTVKTRSKSDRDLRSPECINELKDAADLKRQRKQAKRLSNVIAGGWVGYGYHHTLRA